MTPRERLFALEQFGIKLGLDNITTIVDALRRPHLAFWCVHVGGTNGKGSVTAMVERGLRAAGHRTGRYTSPHLFDIEERVAVNGVAVDSATFDDVTAHVLTVVDGLLTTGGLPHPPTFFEVTTAIAFESFRRAEVSAAVIEVGLGGRFDATNVVTPQVTAITSIDFDHERFLGNTLEQIAFEKAGIIKSKTPIVIGPVSTAARSVIAEVAEAHDAPLIDARAADSGVPVALALNGAHQHANAAVAVEILKRCPSAAGASISHEALVTALTDLEWPARLEWLRTAGGCDVLLDAAHNPSGARALADYVLADRGPMPLIIGVMRDKDVDAIVRALAPAVSQFVAVTVDSPRAMPAGELASRITELVPDTPCEPYAPSRHDVIPAEHAVYDLCNEGRVMVAGSIFLVGPLRARLLAQGARSVRYPSKASRFFLN